MFDVFLCKIVKVHLDFSLVGENMLTGSKPIEGSPAQGFQDAGIEFSRGAVSAPDLLREIDKPGM